jgi:hypothetical protein
MKMELACKLLAVIATESLLVGIILPRDEGGVGFLMGSMLLTFLEIPLLIWIYATKEKT